MINAISEFIKNAAGLILALVIFSGAVFAAIRIYAHNDDIHEWIRKGVIAVLVAVFISCLVFGFLQYQPYANDKIIREFIKAEDTRNFEKIMKYYSINLKKYYRNDKPTLDKLHQLYINNWKLSSNPTTTVQSIKSCDNNVYYVSVIHRSYDNNLDQSDKQRVIYIHLDDQGKIDEIDRPGKGVVP